MAISNYRAASSPATSDYVAMPTGTTVIKGHYKPGMIKRNVINDGDVQTWTSTSAQTTPSLRDELFIACYKDPMAASPSGQIIGANFRINMKWIVQFKDLKVGARYPGAISQATTTITPPTDITTNASL